MNSASTSRKTTKKKPRPTLKPVKGHVVFWETDGDGVEWGTCNCGFLRSSVYTDLVKHLKNLVLEEPKKVEPKKPRVRRERLYDRPLEKHPGLHDLYNTLGGGTRNGGPKRS